MQGVKQTQPCTLRRGGGEAGEDGVQFSIIFSCLELSVRSYARVGGTCWCEGGSTLKTRSERVAQEPVVFQVGCRLVERSRRDSGGRRGWSRHYLC